MRIILFVLLLLSLNNCSLNKNSNFWNEDSVKKANYSKNLEKIMKKSKDLLSMSFSEFEIYINEYNKTTKFPNINK
tara:strand:+ start:354 stop:581 length:228 start_codon:yes stop_codon:yes gene_type:complete